MARVIPFKAYMPAKGLEDRIAALPYDVYNRDEAKEVVNKNPDSFLRIDRAETNFDDLSPYEPEVYDKADELIKEWIASGRFVQCGKPMFYIYQQIMNGRPQTGIVGCASVADYDNNIIKKHENTLAAKEADRISHIDTTNMQTGPIFLAFKEVKSIDDFLDRETAKIPHFDFVSEDGIGHKVWIIDNDDDIAFVEQSFADIEALYIADGHHRCASACRVGDKRHIEGKVSESDFFLAVMFPDNQLKIMDYNRVLKELNGLSAEEFIKRLSEFYHVCRTEEAYKPAAKGECGMYIDNQWYKLTVKDEYLSSDPVEGLDVSILQRYILDGILGIKDPKSDQRIDFVGGIRGIHELERRVHTDCVAAFSMYPTDISELFAVADADLLMPPKSTWFEPKLRSGLFLHQI